MVVKFRASKGASDLSPNPFYVPHTQHERILSCRESYRYASDKTGFTEAKISGYILGLREVLLEELANGNSIVVDEFFRFANVVRGSFATSSGPWVKGKNWIEIGVIELDPFKSFLSDVTCINVTTGAKPVINTVYSGEYDRIVAGQQVDIAGTDLAPDTEAADEGVYVETMEGVKVATAAISYSDLGLVSCTFATLPAAGQYRICVATRSGMGEGIGVAVAKRIITVAG